MHKHGLLLLALIAGNSSAPVAAATNEESARDDESYLAVHLNYAEPDSDRGVDGKGLGATFLYGNEIFRNWFLETRITGLVLERGSSGGTDFYQQDLGFDAVYRFGDETQWRPFALLGVSAIRNDVDVEDQDGFDAALHVGGGVISHPLGRLGLRLRVELRYVHDQFLDGVQDVRLGVGVELPLGGEASGRPELLAVRGNANDSDNDGIGDIADQCANSLPYVKHDANGCMQPDQTIRMYDVTFNNGTSILTAAARAELGDVILALRGQPDLRVQIHGHTDAWGSAQDNRQLSQERAEAVATYLALQGVSTQRVTVKGFGETRPVDSNATAAGRERNRRIEIVLLKPAGH